MQRIESEEEGNMDADNQIQYEIFPIQDDTARKIKKRCILS